jgi:UDP-N-acetyl-D-mannosaminuronic acid dehydrogenase
VLNELVHNDRVIGGMTPKCSSAAVSLYKIFVQGECVITNARTAEMCKLTENSFRDVNIAFANELSIICDKLEINVWELLRLANRHPRVNILQPGPGVGGHCIAVDPWFIVSGSPNEAKIIRTAREVNDSKPIWVLEKVKLAIENHLKSNPHKHIGELTIACFGLTFKPDIDDLRESPALLITRQIAINHKCRVLAVEPNISELPTLLMNLVTLSSISDAISKSDIMILLVEHKQFKEIDIPKGKILDFKGVWMSRNDLKGTIVQN